MWKFIVLIFLFLILGGIYAYQYFITIPEDTSQVLQTGENVIYVAEQEPGQAVLVGFVLMSKEGYVVIYDNNQGEPQNIIGYSRILPEGESRNISIGLTRMTVHGESLFAVLHGDSGDDVFYPTIDIPLRDEDGNIMYMFFGIDENASRAGDFSL